MRGPLERAGYPYALPAVGAPLRVAFVGPRPDFDACVPHAPVAGIVPSFVDWRDGDDRRELRAALAAAAPHVVVALDAPHLPADTLDDLGAASLGIVAAPSSGGVAGYDRLVSTTATPTPDIWRSFPLPVDDRVYAPVRMLGGSSRALFVGASTAYREQLLVKAKHEHDLLHYAHGLWGDAMREVFSNVDIAINVHREGGTAFEHRVLLHLAAGHLLLSEPLAPLQGLEPEVDFIPIARSDELIVVLDQTRDCRELHQRVRRSGRAKAEEYRASRRLAACPRRPPRRRRRLRHRPGHSSSAIRGARRLKTSQPTTRMRDRDHQRRRQAQRAADRRGGARMAGTEDRVARLLHDGRERVDHHQMGDGGVLLGHEADRVEDRRRVEHAADSTTSQIGSMSR